MEMTRRRFAGLMLAAAGAAVAGGWRWMRAQMPRRVVEAACGGRYPGRVRRGSGRSAPAGPGRDDVS
jgi:hypothetical protein